MATNSLTIAQAKAFPAGSPIPVITGTLSKVLKHIPTNGSKGAGTLQIAFLKDGAGEEICLKIWDHPVDYSACQGSQVRIVAAVDKGRCSTTSVLDDYKSKQDTTGKTPPEIQLKVGKSSVFLFSGSSAEQPANQASQNQAPQNPAPTEAETVGAGISATSSQKPIHGASVGAAVNNAIDILKYGTLPEAWMNYVGSKAFNRDLRLMASDLIRIHLDLEAGNLATKEKAAQAPTPTPTPTPSKPMWGPDGSAFPDNNEDETAPF